MAISDWMELRNVLLWSVSIGSSWKIKIKGSSIMKILECVKPKATQIIQHPVRRYKSAARNRLDDDDDEAF